MILSFYGNGKGKTCAALGLSLRASGYGNKILFTQFVKGDWQTGEDMALAKIKNLKHKKFGAGFILPTDTKTKRLQHLSACRKGVNYVKNHAKEYNLVVMDEIFVAIKYKLTDPQAILNILKTNPEVDFILTGRPAIKELVNKSDIASEIRKIKHSFDRGKKAKKGIDY